MYSRGIYQHKLLSLHLNERMKLYEVTVFTGGWKRSWFSWVVFFPRSTRAGEYSGSPWRCSWWCVWLSVFSHSSVTTTTDVRRRKQRRNCVRGGWWRRSLDEVEQHNQRNPRTEQQRRQSSSVSVSLPYHHTQTHLNPWPDLKAFWEALRTTLPLIELSYNFVWTETFTDCLLQQEKKIYNFCLGTNYIVCWSIDRCIHNRF